MKTIIKTIILIYVFINAGISQILINPTHRFGNEWIRYDQTYLKLVIDVNGIYRITKADLINSGFITSTQLFNPKNFQLYFRGKEMAINVVGENDNVFDDNDYIEFYAMKNDGVQDSELYFINQQRINPYYSIYSDETSYFLTISPNQSIKRIGEGVPENSSLNNESYYLAESYNQFTGAADASQDITRDFFQVAYFEPNEGVTSQEIFASAASPANRYDLSVTLANYEPTHNSVHDIKLEGLIHSRANYTKTMVWSVGSSSETKTGSFVLNGLKDSKKYTTTLSNFSNPLAIRVGFSTTSPPVSADIFSYTYHRIIYPSSFVYQNNKEYSLIRNVYNSSISKLVFPSSGQQPVNGYEISDIYSQSKLTIVNGTVYVNDTQNNDRKVFLSNTVSLTPKSISKIVFPTISQSSYDYLIITDPRLRSPSNDYAAYRESRGYRPYIKEVHEIYNEFCYGERNPIAIKRYIDFMTENGGNPKYLLLIGNSYSLSQGVKLPTRTSFDYVPTFGFPGSDVLLTSGLKGTHLGISYIPTGRIPAITPEQVTNYLNKVKAHEELAGNSLGWQKNIIHITGAKSNSEQNSMRTKFNNLNTIVQNSGLGFNQHLFHEKPSSSIESDVPVIEESFKNNINNGASIITYLGHGSNFQLTNNIGKVSDATRGYANKDKYNFLYTNGCGVGDSFQATQTSLMADWLLTKDKGSIAGFSQTFYSFESIDYEYMLELYKTMFGSTTATNLDSKSAKISNVINEYMGDIIHESSTAYILSHPNLQLGSDRMSNLMNTIFFGDPAVKLLTNNTTLPINLISFNSKNIENNIKLSWVTENEINFNKFEIEKSDDLKKFIKIGEVISQKNNGEKNEYEFIDKNISFGNNYYRLKLLDEDNKFKYSNIIYEYLEEDVSELKIYNSPSANNTFEFSLEESDISTLHLIDILGQSINYRVLNEEAKSGRYKVEILGNYPKGNILMKINSKLKKPITKKILFSN
jgi:Peptidase family C25